MSPAGRGVARIGCGPGECSSQGGSNELPLARRASAGGPRSRVGLTGHRYTRTALIVLALLAMAHGLVQQFLQLANHLGVNFHFDFSLAADQQTEFAPG